MKHITIAIDGYSSCGKSTMAKWLARQLGYIYVDTGAMYRAVTLYAMRHALKPNKEIDIERLKELLPQIQISFKLDKQTGSPITILCGEVVEEEIRRMDVSARVSEVAALPFVREAMTAQQRKMGVNGGVVMDGRDVGTAIFPNAELKFFMTADPEIRAKRRFEELSAKGEEVDYEQILQNIKERDYIDAHRDIAPLCKADDALPMNNSMISVDEQNAWILERALRTIKEINQ